MSKELELLKQIKRFDGNMSREQNQRYAELEEALTPPTVDEVCVALSERYNNASIQYLEDKKSFVYGYLLSTICRLVGDGTVYWGTRDLPPHLVTMIGRFYEGLEK